MPKLYLSFLGTSDYTPCTYEHQEERIENVRFVQEATIRMNCMDWLEKDRVIIFTTQKAFLCNWQDNGHRDRKTGDKIPGAGLETCIQNINGNFTYEQVPIPDGSNEKEIWDIFIQVFDSIRHQDEVIFDITHGFRSIPMLAIVVLNYAKIMKQAILKGIYYGALEALGSPAEVREMPLEKRIVPVLDLTAFDQLMEWSVATDRFIGSGDAAQISSIANSSARSILTKTKGDDRSQHTIRRLAESLDKFTKTLSTCRGHEISSVVKELKQTLKNCKNHDFSNPLNLPLKTVLGKIEDQIKEFPGHTIKDGIQAARWCLEHNLIQQSYTILRETLITYFIYKIRENPDDYKNKNRKLAIDAAYLGAKEPPEKHSEKDAQEYHEIIEKFTHFYKTCPELIKEFKNLADYRNDINHAGQRISYRPVEEFTKKMPEFLEIVEKAIKETC